mmetsp:Transcript_1663/g.4269  ORF Transcript_1663/g.4269 Transcript_1663/m.4269 type:complete len:101 (-) Transcript_1663:1331-1633(-)|eukprot:scaffold37091_cov36-Tisochrysis_lutea.AAC.4
MFTSVLKALLARLLSKWLCGAQTVHTWVLLSFLRNAPPPDDLPILWPILILEVTLTSLRWDANLKVSHLKHNIQLALDQTPLSSNHGAQGQRGILKEVKA